MAIPVISGEAVKKLIENIDVEDAEYLFEEIEHYNVTHSAAEEMCRKIVYTLEEIADYEQINDGR